jgi:hypothetical protein
MSKLMRAARLSLAGLMLATGALAADVENPPLFKASAVLGQAAKGPGYRIEERVGSDGYLRIYDVETPWGVLAVHGDAMVAMRLKEIRALDAMERTAASKEFGDALVKAGLKPVEFAEKLVTDPAGTVKGTVTGVGRLFNSIGSGIRNAGKTQESAAAGITGAAKQRRLIAYEYGIDPYTDFSPLRQKLDLLSRAAAAGGLAVTGAFILIPGAAGTVISNVSTAQTLNQLVRDYSAAQLMDMNRKELRRMGASAHTAEEFLTNSHYTPTDATAIAGALGGMGQLRNIDALLARATEAANREQAYFLRRRVELMAAQQLAAGDITGFVALDGVPFPMATTREGGLIGLFPLDALSWTAETSEAITALTTAARDAGFDGPMSLGITGTATPLAEKEVARLGWTLAQNLGR